MKAVALLLLGLSAGTAPASGKFQFYPLHGIFHSREATAKLDPAFLAALGPAEHARFEASFRAAYPEAAPALRESNRRRTFVVSLQVSRASRYDVPKINGNVDVFLPVTASLHFTNVVTGEVLFATTRTYIKTVTLASREAAPGSPTVAGLYAETFRELVDELVADARARLDPVSVRATVRGSWKGLAILDGGRDRGFVRGDTVVDASGNELRLVSVGRNHAVGRVELGAFAEGEPFEKLAPRTISGIRKPRVLPVMEELPAWLPAETAEQLFSDALAAQGPVSLVPVNRTFADVLREVASQTDLSQEKLRQRDLPSHFLRLHVLEPHSYEIPTNLEWATRRITDAVVFAEIVDRHGRVLHAAHGRDRIEDEITRGMAFDLAARKEIAVKNALLDLAKRLGRELKLEGAELPLVAENGAASAKDPDGLLVRGANVQVLRNVGKVGGIPEQVLVPVWEMAVGGSDSGTAELRPALALVEGAPSPRRGDVILVDGARSGLPTRRRLGPCGVAEKLGALDVPGYEPLAMNLFAASGVAPYFATGFGARLAAFVTSGNGFASGLDAAEPAVDFCVQAVHRIDPKEPDCDRKVCADVTSLKLTFRLREGGPSGEVKARRGAETTLRGTGLPPGTGAAARSEALAADVLDQILKVAPAAAGALREEKL